MNKHPIKLINNWQLSYKPIYTFSLVELGVLKAYIKTHLKTSFIQLLKSLTGILSYLTKSSIEVFIFISIIKVLINLLLKINIFLIEILLDYLGQAKWFI